MFCVATLLYKMVVAHAIFIVKNYNGPAVKTTI